MSIIKKIYDVISYPVLMVLNSTTRPTVRLIEQLHPIYTVRAGSSSVKYECVSLVTLWRADTLFTKEPDTIEWIDSFVSGELLYDIGANVGMYSIYAASKGVKVVAFEPESQNFAQLNRNIFLNRFQDLITGFNLALGKSNKIDHLFLSTFSVGGAENTLGHEMDGNHQPIKSAFKQGVMAFTVDELIEKHGLPVPTHIKIDVDGLETDIVSGMDRTLNRQELKSVLIELNDGLPGDANIVEVMKKKGFVLKRKFHAPMFDQTEYSKIYNYIFARPSV